MRRVVLAITLFSLVAIGGCSLEDLLGLAGPPRECPDSNSKGTMTAKFGGDDFEACNTTLSGAPNSSYVIHGLSGDVVPKEILITVVADQGAATYTFGGASSSGDTNAVFLDSSKMLDGDEAEGTYKTQSDVDSGSITFTQIDEAKAVGTFSFTGTLESDGSTTLEVTDGAFDVSF